MNRVLVLVLFAVGLIQAQNGNISLISACPSPLNADSVPRVVTVNGSGFDNTTTAAWQDSNLQVPPVPIQAEFVSSTTIRVTIPGTIGTVAGTRGFIVVSTGNAIATAPLTFSDNSAAISLDPIEFTTQPNAVTFTLNYPSFLPATFGVFGKSPVTIQNNTATVPGQWPVGTLCVTISDSITRDIFVPPLTLPLTVNPLPTIAGTGTARVYAGQTSTVDLAVTGGTPGAGGFQWNVTPALPSWITFQTTGPRTARLIASLPSTSNSDAFTGQVTATDGVQSVAVTSASIPVPFLVDSVPDPVLNGFPSDHKLQPDQQYTIQFGTDRATLIELTGTIVLDPASTARFVVPSPAGPVTANTVSFDIPPGCVMCNSTFTLQAGTAAGAVPITVQLNQTPPSGAATPPPVTYPPFTVQQDPAPPHIDTNRVSACQFPGGFYISTPGYSNTRDMNAISYRFVAVNGMTISAPSSTQPSSGGTLSRNAAGDFQGWFTPPSLQTTQGGFTLTQYFELTGDIQAVGQAYVTLANTAGAGSEFGPIDIARAPRCN